ncbi:YbfB/YjiJ family MFS transporter [Streptomyces sp. NPDC049040]|uniref:YbfB/YjiJ family MFS transporter n=1 Tax=Streptomyces sp. NPDC049040 TaxID=3365593 RepID=UPI0037220AC5
MSVQTPRTAPPPAGAASRSAWVHVARTAAALAAGMGVGRFVFTPILPLMHAQAGLSASDGAHLATANYTGYLLGALAGIVAPAAVRSPALLRGCLVVLSCTLAAMPATHSTPVWIALRLLAGVASALIFVSAVGALHSRIRAHPAHLAGWAFGGVGAGIALSGLLVLALRSAADWRAAWWASAALAAVLTLAAWHLRTEPAPPSAAETSGPVAGGPGIGGPGGRGPGGRGSGRRGSGRRDPGAGDPPPAPDLRRFGVLTLSYTLEGVGYIVAGTFLVAAIEQSSPGWIGGGAWVLVGLAAVPSSALWARLGQRRSAPGLLCAALVVQAAGIALPALAGGTAAALASAVLFGGTFIGVSTLALTAGTRLRVPRSVALLTAGYSVGQILGPLAVAPLLHHGYHRALLLAAIVVLAAAAAAAVLRAGFPHGAAAPPRAPQAPPRPQPDARPRAQGNARPGRPGHGIVR